MLTRVTQKFGFWMSVLMLASTTGCAVMAEAPVRAEEGKVEAIEIHRAQEHNPVNGGTLIGSIAGGVIGHQIGSGRGNTAATIAGALGGAVVGNEIQKKQVPATRYRIIVRLDSGSSQIVEDTRDLNLRVGDRVRIDNGHVHRL